MSENKNVSEVHGCIVCAKTFNLLAIYATDGRLVDCTVTSPGGRCVPDERRPLVVCDTHTADQVERAYKRWTSGKESSNDKEDE